MTDPDPQDDPAARSLFEDVETLIDDGRNAFAAELNFQKTRLAFSARALIRVAVFAVAAVLLAFFVLIALTVGLVMALVPSVTAWGATAIVAGTFLLAMLASLWLVWRNFRRIRAVFMGNRR